MKPSRYGSRLLAVWCGLCAGGFFATAAWLDFRLEQITPYEPSAELLSTLQTTDNIEGLRTAAMALARQEASTTNYMQMTLPTKAFISLALTAGGAFMLTAALAWALKRERTAEK